MRLDAEEGPFASVVVDQSKPVVSVDLYYTQQGEDDESRRSIAEVTSRFWHHVAAENHSGKWNATLPEVDGSKPLWVFANVMYELPSPVTGAGYYYGPYTTDVFNVSSLLKTWSSETVEGSWCPNGPTETITPHRRFRRGLAQRVVYLPHQ